MTGFVDSIESLEECDLSASEVLKPGSGSNFDSFDESISNRSKQALVGFPKLGYLILT